MENFKTIFGVFAGCLSVTFIAWLIVHFNGKTILSIIDSVFSLSDKLQNKSKYSKKNWLQVATEAEIIILGLTPLAIASLVSTSQGKCYNSIATFTITEAIILCLFLLNSKSANWSNNLFGKDFVRDRFLVFILAIIWCLVFSIWGFVAIDPGENYGIDRLLVNRNGDMWFYTRRFAAYIFSNLNFDSQPACSYLQISPKKFSSFIGSLLVYVSPNTVFGITLFQGLAGCSLFLSLFGNWPKFTYRGKSLSGRGTFFAVIWAIASPSIFWLIITLLQRLNSCCINSTYVLYFLAYIPLEFTYRLGKFAISIIYPLAMFGFLPTILWWRDRYYRGKSDLFKFVCSLLITLHIILHIDKALANAQPTGKYQIISTDNIENIKRLTIVRCQQTSVSQKYEKIVGLDLAKQYPQLKINVITEGDITNNYPQTDLVLKGTDLKGKEKNLCIFEIDI